MKTTRRRASALALFAPWAAALCAGLGAAAAQGQTQMQTQTQADPGRFVSPAEGTVHSYHRTSQGSYGAYDGPVSWTVGRREWNGRTFASFASATHGSQIMDLQTHAVMAQFNPQGQPAYSFNPGVAYEWPLAVGKSWTSVHEMTMYTPPRVVSITFNFKVEALEDVTVPAGTFKAFKVVSTNSFGEVEQVWTAPSLGIATLKRIADRPATHGLGAGHLEAVLTSRSVPPR